MNSKQGRKKQGKKEQIRLVQGGRMRLDGARRESRVERSRVKKRIYKYILMQHGWSVSWGRAQ